MNFAMNLYTLFGSNQYVKSGTRFDRGAIVTIFGETKVDLRGAQLAKNEVILNVITIFGSTAVRVPSEWQVENSAVSVLASAEGQEGSRQAEREAGRLQIQGLVLMGECRFEQDD